MKKFKLEVLSQEATIFEGEALSLTAVAADGKLGVLADHAPLLTVLSKGELSAKLVNAPDLRLNLTSGLLKVEGNKAQVLLS